MKRIILALFVAVFAFSAMAQEMNVATFNIRVSGPLKPGQARPKRGDYSKFNGWDDRKDHLCNMIKFEAFDVFGVQEARYPQISDMLERMPEYAYIGVGRDDGAQKGEHCAIFYLKKKFKVLDQGNFWLSETPDVPSYGWGAKYRRVCTWGLFQNKKTKELFYLINTHVNWGKSSVMSANMLVDFVKEKCTKTDNVILMADFNATQDSDLYKIITSNGFEDTYESSKYRFAPTGTGQGFRTSYFTHRRIDHIFVKKGIESSRYGVLTYHYFRDMKSKEEAMETAAPKEIKGENRDVKLLSDHYAVQSFITLKKSAKKSKR
ncbi:MAG: endonuclease/exonuclease/phosphatase family protein [Alistipes sp.]|nr:endonuclease/exonuclease/phosphatase family protein [Alistipes sp.]